MRTLRAVSLPSVLTPDEYLASLDGMASAWSEAAAPATLRRIGIGGVRVRRRGSRFVLSLRRRRRSVAPVICTGRVMAHGTGSRIRAEVRPSRTWLWFPAGGTLLFLVQLGLAPPSGTALVGYAVAIGALWAVNLLAATMPMGTDPVAEADALEGLLREAATGGVVRAP